LAQAPHEWDYLLGSHCNWFVRISNYLVVPFLPGLVTNLDTPTKRQSASSKPGHPPLQYSSLPVQNAVPRLSPGLSHLA